MSEIGQNKELNAVLEDASASYWIKNAIKSALSRDPIDAANDAERLAYLLKRNAEKTLGGN